jgi:glyoxylase-like metal-dependent hydrolase (beta-lactamase superfamily II)
MNTSPESSELQVRLIPVTPLQQNCSLIWNERTRSAVMVDPGGDLEVLLGALRHFNLQLREIWLTHGHLDHAGAATALREATGAPIIGPHADDQWLLDEIETQGRKYGLTDGRNCTPDRYLNDGDLLRLDDEVFGVAHCPGHTPGHVAIFSMRARIAFVGDVLFAGSIGRTDFPRGNHDQLIASIIGKLWPLGDDMRFVPGHGPTGTFGEERRTNPFVADRFTGYGGEGRQSAPETDRKLAKRWS